MARHIPYSVRESNACVASSSGRPRRWGPFRSPKASNSRARAIGPRASIAQARKASSSAPRHYHAGAVFPARQAADAIPSFEKSAGAGPRRMRFEGLPPSPPFAPLPVYARAFLLGSLPPFGKKTSEKPTTTSPRYYYASSISVLLPPFPQYSSREEPRKQRESGENKRKNNQNRSPSRRSCHFPTSKLGKNTKV